jgi:hypothetical protein
MTENLKHPLDSFSQSPKRPSKISKTTDDQEVVVQEQSMRIQRYLVAIEYNGTRFSGSQQQSNCRTVVGVLEVIHYLLTFVVVFFFFFSFIDHCWDSNFPLHAAVLREAP